LIHQQPVAQQLVVPGAIRNPSDVQGLVATQRIYSGEQVTARSFQPLVAEGARGQITGTTRVMQLPGDSNQLLVGTLKAGDHVDVISSLKYRLANFRGTPVSSQQAQQDLVGARIVLRDLLVLQTPGTPAGASKFGGSSQYEVLLSLTDSQAQKLFFVTKNGDWTLQLRPAHAAADSPDSVDTTGSVLGDGLQNTQFSQLVFGPAGPK
jgi:Flp pilus assembly protein CpaB